MILVTGGTGFLGSYIVDELLQRGEKVRLLARNSGKVSPREGVDIAEGDLLDRVALAQALEGVDRVIHAAAVVSFWSPRFEEMREVNIKGTESLVDTCLEMGVKKLVNVSSVAALGRSGSGAVIDEKTKWSKSKLNSQYGRTKYLAELEVQRGVQEGLAAVMVNPGIIIGAGNWQQGAPKLFYMVHKGLKYYNPGGAGFVPAVDVARAIYLLLQSDFVEGERFVLVSDSLPYKDFFGMVAESVKGKPPHIMPPQSLVRFGAWILHIWSRITKKEPLITPETARFSRYHSVYDGSKITKAIDFKYSDLHQIIMQTGKQLLEENGH